MRARVTLIVVAMLQALGVAPRWHEGDYLQAVVNVGVACVALALAALACREPGQ